MQLGLGAGGRVASRGMQQAQSFAQSEKFAVHGVHSLDFWCADATSACKRFQFGLGMAPIAKSDSSTGNTCFTSYVLANHGVVFAFTAPYRKSAADSTPLGAAPLPGFEPDTAFRFVQAHGLAVRAVAISVDDATQAFETACTHGATPMLEPCPLGAFGSHTIAEVQLYGDVALRFVSNDAEQPLECNYLPGFADINTPPALFDGGVGNLNAICFERVDHIVGNVPLLEPQVEYMRSFTGFHRFANFHAEEVGTRESGLNSTVCASDNRMVLLPVNEPTHGTKRKSQIQMYLEENEGSGVQHIALKTPDIFNTVREMRRRADCGGFDFMPRPPDEYYRNLPNRVGDSLTEKQYRLVEELGILADVDDEGVLLQVFTTPVCDRPTLFLEIIQRIGCHEQQDDGAVFEKPGCGGFGKGNFAELFKQVERFQDEAGFD